MAYSSYVGSFNIDTSKTAGQTQAVTGVGFTPKVVLFWWSGTTATSDGARGEDINAGFGALSGASARWAMVQMSDDAAPTMVSSRAYDTASCILSYLNGSETLDGAADWGSFDGDGFTLTIDDQFSTALRVSFLALGGTDLTNVAVGSDAFPTGTGNFSKTSIGFQPDAMIIGSNATETAAGRYTSARSMGGLGFATGNSNQGVVSLYNQNATASSTSSAYGYNGEVTNGRWLSDSDQQLRSSFVSFDADGFTLNLIEANAAYYYHYVLLKGGQYKVSELTTRTDGNDIAETDPGFQPVALLFLSANRALSTQQTYTANLNLSIGAATSTTNRAAQAIWSENALADSELSTANYDTAAYVHVRDDAVAALMDIKSIDASGFTAVMDDTEPTAGSFVTYLAIGATAAGGGGVDSASKRISAVRKLKPWIAAPILPDSTLSQGDRQHAAMMYSGVLAGGGAIGGTASITESADTLSASGAVAIAGSAGITESPDTLNASGAVAIAGTASITEGADTLSGSGVVGSTPIDGNSGIAEGADTLSAAGAVAIAGTGSITEGADTLSSAGAVAIAGTAGITESPDTINAAGAVTITGTAGITESADTLSAAGTVSITGTASITEGADTLAGAGVVGSTPIDGNSGITEGADTLSAAGAVTLAGTASITEGADTLSASGAVSITGTAGITESPDTLSAAGTVTITGTAGIIEGADTLSAAGTVSITGTASITEGADTLAGAGVVGSTPIDGTSGISEGADTLSASGKALIAGSGGNTESGDTSSSSGGVVIAGTVTITESGDIIAAEGFLSIVGTANLSDLDTTQTAGTVSIAGLSSITESADTLTSSGTTIPYTPTAAIFFPSRDPILASARDTVRVKREAIRSDVHKR